MADVRIHLRDTETGKEAWHVYQMDDARVDDPDDPEGWWWTDGNAACDCERMRVLAAAFGKPDPNIACGDTRVVIEDAIVNGQPRESWCDPRKRRELHGD
jgi:hypothetical protein